MTGTIAITQYNNMGDLSLETPMEPAFCSHRIAIGAVSEPIDTNTRLICLFASADCEFAFFDDAKWKEGSDNVVPDTVSYVPLAAKTEVTRIVHAGTTLRIATR